MIRPAKDFPGRRNRKPERGRYRNSDEFVAGAPVGGVPLSSATLSKARQRKLALQRRIWERMERDADPSRGINVRLNEYELTIFQAACEQSETPLQRIARRLFREWAEERLQILPEEEEMETAEAQHETEPFSTEAFETEPHQTEP